MIKQITNEVIDRLIRGDIIIKYNYNSIDIIKHVEIVKGHYIQNMFIIENCDDDRKKSSFSGYDMNETLLFMEALDREIMLGRRLEWLEEI